MMGDYTDYKILRKLSKIAKYLELITSKILEMEERDFDMSVQLDELELQVAETLGAEQSAITLLQGISQRLSDLADDLAEAGIDNAKVLELRDELDAGEVALAAAVAAVPL
jgi:hypothetical protein